MQELGTLGGPVSIAYSVTADGLVVAGASSTTSDSAFPMHAFRWSEAEGMQDLGILDGAVTSGATDVNADGSVIVGSNDNGAAFRWTASAGMQELGSLVPNGASAAYAVTDDGRIIAGFADGTESGVFRWNSVSGMQEVGLNGIDPLQFEISPYDLSMSADGAVMGGAGIDLTVFPDGQYRYRAWLWTELGGLMQLEPYLTNLGLNLTGWELHDVTGLSFDGSTIVGTGTFEGVATSWMVSGVPAPGGSSVIAIGLVAASRRRRPVVY